VPTQRPSTVRLRTSLFHEAAEIVDREYAADLSLDDIARRVASSRRQLQRAYAEIGQTTFRDHLTRVGLMTERYVTFRRYQGVAPSDFRAGGSARSAAHAQALGSRPDGLRPAYRAA
jgi:AraC-like DNA-binding protein